jgi:hypothetical protein
MQRKATNLKGETSIFAGTPYLINLLLPHIDPFYITGLTYIKQYCKPPIDNIFQ